MRKFLLSLTSFLVVVFMSALVCLGAVTNTWNGSTDTDWFTATNWSESVVPTNGQYVIIDSISSTTNVLLTNSTASLASFVITSNTLTFTNWTTTVTASNVTIQSGGEITLPAAFTNNTMSNRVHIVCTNFTIEAGGKINADEKGYAKGNGLGVGGSYAANAGGGGGYGGKGGHSLGTAQGGSTYGSVSDPLDPGSGSGGDNPGNANDGGGAIRIEATGNVTVNGVITANGGGAGFNGGSGGGIYIMCKTFGGSNGVIQAKGGMASGEFGDGGGGRIAVHYQNLAAQPSVQFSASHGDGSFPQFGYNIWDARASKMGTLYFSNTNLLSECLDSDFLTNVVLVIPEFTNWTPNSLTVSNGLVGFQDGLALAVGSGGLNIFGSGGGIMFGANSEPTSAGAITINSGQLVTSTNCDFTCLNTVSLNGGKLMADTNSQVSFSGDMLSSGEVFLFGNLDCASDLTLTNGGLLYVYSGKTNGLSTNYGVSVSVTGQLFLASSCWIYPYSHETDGGSVFFQVGSLFVSTNAGFDADWKGYTDAQGPGQGVSGIYAGGAGYGGKGGDGKSFAGGFTYGSTNAPVAPGSGGGTQNSTYKGGKGGGAVRIEAEGMVVVNGTIRADAENGSGYAGGGSGGAIYITCQTFGGSSNGILSARGGNDCDTYGDGGGGGGGRIAVWYGGVPKNRWQGIRNGNDMRRVSIITNASDYSGFAGTVSVTNGTGWTNEPPDCAYPGTVVFLTVTPPSGTMFMCQ